MFKRKQTTINHETVSINHLRKLDNRQYKYFIQSIEKYREADGLLERSNRLTGDDKLIDEVTNLIETEGYVC